MVSCPVIDADGHESSPGERTKTPRRLSADRIPRPECSWRGPTSRVGIVNAYVNGASDVVLIGSMKNIMTQSILAKPDVTKLAQLKGKRIGVTRIGSNTHTSRFSRFAAPA
jgi:hypothetical protein